MHTTSNAIPRLTVVALLIAGLAVAGCGSDNKKSSSAPKVTKAQFLTRANAVCRKGDAQQMAAGKSLGNHPSKAQLMAYFTKTAIPNIQAQIAGVRAVGLPTGDEAQVKHMLALAQADVEKVKAKPALLAGNNDPFANFAKLAHPYGLTDCDKGN